MRRTSRKSKKTGLNAELIWKNRLSKRERAIVYIDGFNLYYGMKSKGFERYFWLNVHEFARLLCPANVPLSRVKYFTARIDAGHRSESAAVQQQKQAKQRRQFDYLEAIKTLSFTDVIEGKYLRKRQSCRSCSVDTWIPEEKESDVNIATELLVDAYNDRFTLAIVVSGDSDLCGPIRAVRDEFPHRPVVVAFPPERKSRELTKVATSTIDVFRRTLAKSQFPDTVKISNGSVSRPANWT